MTADLKQLIRDELVAFAWDDFGLDDVDAADTEWAENLAALIADAVSRRVRPELVLDDTEEASDA